MEGNSSAGWTTATSEARPHGGIFRTPLAPFFSTVARVLVLSSLLSVDAQLSKYRAIAHVTRACRANPFRGSNECSIEFQHTRARTTITYSSNKQ